MNKLLTFIAGCGTGIIAGLILAPTTGRELRGNLTNKVQEGVDAFNERVGEGRRYVEEQGGMRGVMDKGMERGRNIVNIGVHRVSEKIQQGKDRLNESLESGRNRVNEAIDAGRSEYLNQRDRDVSGI